MTRDMPERHPVAKLRVPSTRTQDGKKVDTWKIDLPGGESASFDVRMHVSNAAGIHFDIATGHPLFRHLDLRDDSMERLRQKLTREVENATEETIGKSWKPGFIVETRARLHDVGRGRRQSTVDVNVEAVRFLQAEAGSNDPHVRVIKDHVSMNVRERAASERFTARRTGLDAENLSDRREVSDPVSRVVVEDTEENRRKLDELQSVLCRFGDLLAERLAPQRMEAGFPEMQEVAFLLDEAIRDGRRDPDPVDELFQP